jgi:hypothetical protein
LRIDTQNNELIKKWFDEEIGDGENCILVYPNLQAFRQIYTQHVKEQLAKEEEDKDYNNEDKDRRRLNEQSKPRITLVATFYETIDSVKHNLHAVGVGEVQRHIDNGSLVIVDSFHSYFPDIDGMKKLVASLSDRAKKEGRSGVTAIVDMSSFFLFGGDGKATALINYEASLLPKTDGSNVKGISCYHVGDYDTLKDSQKKELFLAQGQNKKVLEVTEGNTL